MPEYTYTRDDFLTPAPYESVLAISNVFEREIEISRLSDYAAGMGVRGFKKTLKAYVESKMKSESTFYIDSTTGFTGQPLELDTGCWRADDCGVSRKTEFGEDIACPHPIMPVERLVNIDTGIEKLRIAFSKGRRWRDAIVDKQTLATANKIVAMADMGVAVTSENARSLVRYLSDVENINYERIPERKSVGRLGYIEDEGFSPYVDGLVFDGDANYRTIFNSIANHGKADEWLKTARECRKNSLTARIVLASAFASVLVQRLGGLPFFVHLWGGESGTGKTVALMLAASVWGDPSLGKYIQTFNSTAVGHEKTAAFLNNLPLLVDELQLAKDRSGKPNFNVYLLAQGVGKTRGNKSGGIDKTPTWSNCIITTGESPLTTGGDGAGALNRVIDIECSPSEKVIMDGQRVAGELRKNYGFAGRAFVRKLAETGVFDAIEDKYRTAFKTLSESDTTEKQAMAAAMVVVADELITEWFFKDGKPLTVGQISTFLQTKASVSAGERGYRYMCDWVAQNGARMRAGIETGDVYGVIDGDWAFIISKVFREAAEDGGFSSTALLSYLKQRNLIQLSNGRNTVKKRIGSINTWCVAMLISAEIDGQEGADDVEIIEI